MKLSYESRLEDVSESAVRLFLRGKSYTSNRWRGAVLCAAVFTVFAFLGFHARGVINIVWICIGAAAWGAGLFLLTYKSTVRKRIASYVARETAGKLPHTTIIEITDAKIISTGAGIHMTFPLSALLAATEDKTHLELSFGDKGICLIPLRAFSSEDEKTAFIAATQRG
jgi:hypothetical protein